MPARKPKALSVRHSTRAENDRRERAESAVRPVGMLPTAPPAELKGRKIASATWKRMIGEYNKMALPIVTTFDLNLLVKYCKLEEEVIELEEIRDETNTDFETQRKAATRMKGEDAWKAWTVVNALSQRLQGWDARLDGKRKLLLTMEQSLYLTPRSRAGVAPPEKEADGPVDEMDALLSE